MAVRGIEAYHRPPDVPTAWQLLQAGGDHVRLLAGGSDLAVSCPPEVTTLVDLQAAGLRGIEAGADGALTFGAMTTFTDLLHHPEVAAHAGGVMVDLLGQLGSVLHRNSATVGGHLARARMSDVVPVLLALDAEVVVHTDEVRTLALADYLEQPRPPHVLTAVRLPALPTRGAGAFVRFTRAAFDHSLVNGCAFVAIDGPGESGDPEADAGDASVATARVVVGEVGALGRRVPAAEDVLHGRTLDAVAIAEAVTATRDTVSVRERGAASSDYRRHLAGVAVGRCLETVRARLEGAGRGVGDDATADGTGGAA
jgi:aerobic carbon-monoxide dehydrogenase medium subunit